MFIRIMMLLGMCAMTLATFYTVESSELVRKTAITKVDKNKVHIVLSADNALLFDQAFEPTTVAKLLDKAKELDANLPQNYPMFLVMFSPGGSIDAGIEMANVLKSLNRPVHTITVFAASMGFQTVQQLDNRYILSLGELMSHNARGQFSGEFGQDGSQIDSRYQHWMRRILSLDKQTVKRTNGKQTLKSYRKAYENELWIMGEEAVKEGYADAVASVSCDSTLKGTYEETYVRRYFGFKVTFVITKSKCPLILSPIEYQVFVNSPDGTVINYYNPDRKSKEGDTFTSYSYHGVTSDTEQETNNHNNITPELDKFIQDEVNKITNKVKDTRRNIIRMSFSSN